MIERNVEDNKGNLFVFVKYDLFPYFLGFPGEMSEDGGFTVESVGKYPRKAIIAIYPRKLGEEMHEKLTHIKLTCVRERNEITDRALRDMTNILPELDSL